MYGYYNNVMVVAVTGLSGRVGKALVGYGFHHQNLKIRGLVRTPFPPDASVEPIQGDLFDRCALRHLIKGSDTVLHLAADTATPSGRDQLENAILLNAVGTANLVNMLRERTDEPRLVYISTAHVYSLSKKKSDRYLEDELDLCEPVKEWLLFARLSFANSLNSFCGNNIKELRPVVRDFLKLHPPPWQSIENEYGYSFVYEISKLLGEFFVRDYESHFVVRPTYLYGPTDRENLVSTLFLDYFKKGQISCWEEERDFMHYENFIDLLLALVKLPESKLLLVAPDRIINGGVGTPTSCEEIERMCLELDMAFARHSSKVVRPKKRDAGLVSNNRAIAVINLLRRKELISTVDGFREMAYRAIIDNVIRGEVVTPIIGGSAAHVYLITTDAGYEIFKISAKEGAENGREKISAEFYHAEAVRSYLGKRPEIGYGDIVLDVTTSHSSDSIAFFTSRYYNGKSMRDLVCNELQCKSEILGLVCELQRILLAIYAAETITSPRDFFDRTYTGRVYRRLNGVVEVDRRNGSDFFSNLPYIESMLVNGMRYKNPLEILREIRENESLCRLLAPNLLGVCASGDPIPDNIVVCKDGFHIIDPRGDVVWMKSKFTGDPTPFYDPLYDVGKLLFYFTGWKMVRDEMFELGYDSNTISLAGNEFILRPKENRITNLFKEIQAEFLQASLENGLQDQFCFGDNPLLRLAFITATHFLADTHPRMVGQGENKKHQTLAMYLIGTILLNRLDRYLRTPFINGQFTNTDFQNVLLWQDTFL